jgi:hypothetical protein
MNFISHLPSGGMTIGINLRHALFINFFSASEVRILLILAEVFLKKCFIKTCW